MIEEFKTYLSPGYPSLRIGTKVPQEAINLAFFNLPRISPLDCAQVFDYSKRVSENSLQINDFQTELFVRSDGSNSNVGVLSSPSGDATFPVNNVLMTSKHLRTNENRLDPLFYCFTTRFLHYEVGLPVGEANEYLGESIVVLENGVPTSKPHLIEVKAASIPNTWEVTVFSSFTTSKDELFYIEYTKLNSTSGTFPNIKYEYKSAFREILKPKPIFTNLGCSVSSVLDLKSRERGEKVFASEKLGDRTYRFWTTESSVTNSSRTPVIFRWRIKAATTSGAEHFTPWRQETLFSAESLCSFEWNDSKGAPLYSMHDGIAKKLLIYSPKYAFNNITASSFTIETQVWQSGSWANDSYNKVIIENESINGIGPVFAYTFENTGTIDTTNSKVDIAYDDITVPITIEGYVNSMVDEFIPSTVKKISYSAYATYAMKINALLFPNVLRTRTSILDSEAQPRDVERGSARYRSLLYYISKESETPPEEDAVLTVNLPKNPKTSAPYEVTKIRTVLGYRGEISKVEAYNGTSLVYQSSSPTKTTISSGTNPVRIYDFFPPSSTSIDKVLVYITPTLEEANVGGLKGLLLKLFKKKMYTAGFDIVSFETWTEIPGSTPTETAWKKTANYSVSMSKNEPFLKNFHTILDELGLKPPDNLSATAKANVKYRVMIGDGTGSSISGYDNLATLNFYDVKTGKYIFNTQENTANLSFTDPHNQSYHDVVYSSLTPTTNLQVRTDKHSVIESPIFTVKSVEDNRIYIDQIKDKSEDEMWFLSINNGSFTIEDFVNKKTKEYSISEFWTQSFDQTLGFPYSKSIFEEALFIDNHHLRVNSTPLYVKTLDGNPTIDTLILYKESEKNKPLEERQHLTISDWNPYTGDIFVEEYVEYTERIFCDYAFERTNYEYKGYEQDGVFYLLDLNPLPGHQYVNSLGEYRDSRELFSKNIYLYCVPSVIIDNTKAPLTTGHTINADGGTIRHTIVDHDTLESEVLSSLPPDAVLLGKVLVRNNYKPSMVTCIDTRSRGGGFKHDLSVFEIENLSKESRYVWDIASWDGHPYPSNGVIVLQLPSDIQQSFSEEEIRRIINQYISYGIYCIIQYI